MINNCKTTLMLIGIFAIDAKGSNSSVWMTARVAVPRILPKTMARWEAGETITDCKNPSFLSSINEIIENIDENKSAIINTPG